MAIMFKCSCGKVMQAREEFAGRKVKCSACDAVLLIPKPHGEPAAPAETPPAPIQEVQAPPPPLVESRERIQAERPPAPAASSPNPASWENGSLDQRGAPWDREAKRRREPYRERQGMAAWMKATLVLLVVGVMAGGVWLLVSSLSRPENAAASQLALVPADGTGFGTVKVAELWNSKAFEKLRLEAGPKLDDKLKAEMGLSISDIERVTVSFGEKEWIIGPGMDPVFWVVVHTKVPVDQNKILTTLMPDRMEQKVERNSYFTSPKNNRLALRFVGEKEIWASSPTVLVSLLNGTRKIATEGPLAESIRTAAADKHHLLVSFHLPEKVKQQLRDTPALPPEMAMIKDFVSGQVTFNGTEGGDLEMQLGFANPDAARGAGDLVQKGLAMLREGGGGFGPGEAAWVGMVGPALKNLTVEVKGADLVMRLPNAGDAIASTIAPLIAGVGKVREAATRMQASNNMKQMLLAMHGYHDVYKKLPPARSKSGLSWRVAILPYIDQDALYRRFHLDEPWDSPHNIKLLDEMPEIYKPVGGPPAKAGYTCYQVFSGDKLVFHPTLDLKSKLITIADGTSNTILIVEASNLVPWTAPQDVRYQPFRKDAPPRLGYQQPGAFLVGMGDGVANWLTTDIPQEMLDRLIAPNDGNVVEFDRFFAR